MSKGTGLPGHGRGGRGHPRGVAGGHPTTVWSGCPRAWTRSGRRSRTSTSAAPTSSRTWWPPCRARPTSRSPPWRRSRQARASVGQAQARRREHPERPAPPSRAWQAAQDQLSGALSRLLVVVERYPDLKATQNFRDLQAQLEGTENRIAVERDALQRDGAGVQHRAPQRFPTGLFAGFLGFQREGLLQGPAGRGPGAQGGVRLRHADARLARDPGRAAVAPSARPWSPQTAGARRRCSGRRRLASAARSRRRNAAHARHTSTTTRAWWRPRSRSAWTRSSSAFDDQTSSQIVVAVFPELPSPSWRTSPCAPPRPGGSGAASWTTARSCSSSSRTGRCASRRATAWKARSRTRPRKRIIDERIAPAFRNNDYAGGLEAGIDAMMAATRGEYTALAARPRAAARLPAVSGLRSSSVIFWSSSSSSP